MRKFLIVGGAVAVIAAAAIVFVVMPSGNSSAKHLNAIQSSTQGTVPPPARTGTGVTTTTLKVTAPVAPTNPTAQTGRRSANVYWTAPDDGGSPITSYTVTPYENGAPVHAQASWTQCCATTLVVGGLADGVSVSFTVAATNAIGTSRQSSPTDPFIVGSPSRPADFRADLFRDEVHLNWTTPWAADAPLDHYVITPYLNGVTPQAQIILQDGVANNYCGCPANSWWISKGLSHGAEYSFTLAAVNSWGTGMSASSKMFTIGGPNSPVNPTASASSTGVVVVSWSVPQMDGGGGAGPDPNSLITSYVITPCENGTLAKTSKTFDSAATTEQMTGLLPGHSYTFRVFAINNLGPGAWSETPLVTIPVPTHEG